MARSAEQEVIAVGKVSKPHGIRGELKVYPYSGQPDMFADSYERLFLQFGKGKAQSLVEYRVERARVQGKQVIVALAECRDRTMAEQLAGCEVYVAKDDLPPLAEDEYYLYELVGKELVDREGRALGKASRIMTAGAQDQLVVQQGDREYLVPIVSAFIAAIERDRVVLDLPPGLVDVNG